MDDFVEVEEGDVVFDVGAFIGGFSINAARKAKVVHSFEPTPDTYRCLKRNTKNYGNIHPHDSLLWKDNGSLTLQIGSDPTDNSTINIDDGSPIDEIEKDASTIESMASDLGLTEIDFLKVDAEGAEPEVIEGIGDLSINKLAIDCGAERHSEPTFKMVKDYIEPNGYEIDNRGQILFARCCE